jgi:predicted DNA-binding protein with PD1-like motif
VGAAHAVRVTRVDSGPQEHREKQPGEYYEQCASTEPDDQGAAGDSRRNGGGPCYLLDVYFQCEICPFAAPAPVVRGGGAKHIIESGGAMKSKLISGAAQKTYAVIFDPADEVMQGLEEFARAEQLTAAQFTALGAFSDAVLGYFEIEKKEYKRIPVREQVEVLALVGDVSLKDGKPAVHAHVVLGKSDGTAHGGHLLEAHVRPTLEVILTESPRHLERRHDEESGFARIRV